MQDDLIQVRVTKEVKNKLRAEAEHDKTGFSKVVKKAVDFYLGFDKDFFDAMEAQSLEMGMRQADFIQGLVINQVAMHSAFRLVMGTAGKGMIRPFKRDVDGKLLKGQELTEFLLDTYLNIFADFKGKTEKQKIDKKNFKVSAEQIQVVLSETEQSLSA
jgi:hypothetical protein